MPLYEVEEGGLALREPAAFAGLKMYERADIQRMLREKIEVLDPDLLVIAEEFGNWEDARRRIDLLAIDRQGRLVVIEIKRTEDGGHMELQAIRYAAMVSSMEFPEVLVAFSAHCAKHRPDVPDAHGRLIEHLEAEPGEDPVISSNVRIMLVSADFGREITTAVLWLNDFDGMDIRCVRLVPYEISGKVLINIEQVIPLPEAADYQVRLRRKDAARERAKTEGPDWTMYHIVIEGSAGPALRKRQAIRSMVETLASRGASLDDISKHLPQRKVRVVSGQVNDNEVLREALVNLDPKIDIKRWFTDHPIVDFVSDKTYVISKMWGLDAEPMLEELSTAFPDAKVSFSRANESES
ncbi:MAG: hypothetical protein WD942_05680 [Dehalococcoidia bacterium]